MKLRLTVILPIFALVLCPFGEAASGKTKVDDNHLENTSIGFHGFAVDVPFVYYPYTPPPSKKFEPQSHPDLAWLAASHFDRRAGYHTTELFPYQCRNRGLVVTVVSTDIPIPPVKLEKEHLRVLDMFTSWALQNPARKDFVRDTRKIGSHHVGRVGTAHQGSVVAGNFVLIPPATILAFIGAAPEAEKDDLLADLDAAVATLNTGKRPRR